MDPLSYDGRDPLQNAQLRDEIEALKKLRHAVTSTLIRRLPEPGGQRYDEAPDRIETLANQRDGLLEALHEITGVDAGEVALEIARAAIAKATGEE